MTWSIQDTQRQGHAGRATEARGSFLERTGQEGQSAHEAPLAPEETALFSWGATADEDDLPVSLLSRAQERELQWEGMPTAQEWGAWSRIARRGVEEVGDGVGGWAELDTDG